MQETKKYIVAIHLGLPAYVTVLNSGVTPGLRFRGTRDSYSYVYFCFPGSIGATCSLYVEFCFFNFSNADNPGKRSFGSLRDHNYREKATEYRCP